MVKAAADSDRIASAAAVLGVDRSGKPIDQAFRREETLRMLGTLFRGATAFPPGRGVWREDDDGALLFEDVVLVTSYATADDVTDEALRQLRVFLHRLGREAGQGEVGLVVDGT